MPSVKGSLVSSVAPRADRNKTTLTLQITLTLWQIANRRGVPTFQPPSPSVRNPVQLFLPIVAYRGSCSVAYFKQDSVIVGANKGCIDILESQYYYTGEKKKKKKERKKNKTKKETRKASCDRNATKRQIANFVLTLTFPLKKSQSPVM